MFFPGEKMPFSQPRVPVSLSEKRVDCTAGLLALLGWCSSSWPESVHVSEAIHEAELLSQEIPQEAWWLGMHPM